MRLVAVIGGVAIAAAIVVIVVWPRSSHQSRVHVAHSRPLPTPSATAFTDGGVPIRDPAMDSLIVDLCRDVTRSDGRIERGLQPAALVAHGRELATAWGVMTDSIADWGDRPRDQRDDLVPQIREDLRAMTDQMVAAGLGYALEFRIYHDSRSTGASAVLHGFRVDDVAFVIAGGNPRRVLGLRRIDANPSPHGALGLESTDMGPVLMLDPIAGYAVSDVLPVAAPDAPFLLGDLGWRQAAGKALAALAGAAVRAELVRALGADAQAATTIAKLVAERTAIVEHWERVPLHVEGLYLPDGLMARAEKVSDDDRARVNAIEVELDDLEADRIAARLETIVAASVRRHEAQHGFDQDRAAPLASPKQIDDIVGGSSDDVTVKFARAELDAYLSQIINDPATPHLTLWGVATFAYGRAAASPEGIAGSVIVDGIARELGTKRPDGMRDRAWLVTAGTAIASATGERIRDAARALWTELYAEPPVVITDR